MPEVQQSPGLLLDEDEFRIDGAMLDHGIPCFAFALTEKLRVNVWREGLRQLELPVGSWLREAKRAVRQGAPAALCQDGSGLPAESVAWQLVFVRL